MKRIFILAASILFFVSQTFPMEKLVHLLDAVAHDPALREALIRGLNTAEADILRQQALAMIATQQANSARYNAEAAAQETRQHEISERNKTERTRYEAERANAQANYEKQKQQTVREEQSRDVARHQQILQTQTHAADLDRKNKRENADYQDQLQRTLLRDRQAEEDRRQRTRLEEKKRAKEEAIKRDAIALQERLKREEESHRKKIREEVEAAKLKAKADAEKEKELAEHKLQQWADPNKKAALREMENYASERRIKETRDRVGAIIEGWRNAIFDFTGDKERMLTAGKFIAGTGAALAGGIYTFKHGIPIVRKLVEDALFTPRLIDESSYSRLGWLNPFKKKREYERLENLYFDDQLADLILEIKETLTNTKKNKGYYLNYLFYGPPGTGKTATARALAYESGMDFAFMTGGSILDLLQSGKAIARLNEVFDWAKSSKKGLVLFIDEADAFLGHPQKMSEELQATLKAFLNRTGAESKNICVILSSNHPNQIAKAVLNRISYRQQIKFDVPGSYARKQMVEYFANKYLLHNKKIDTQALTPELLDYVAEQTDGFVGRDISYLMLGLEKAALAQPEPMLTRRLVERVISEAKEAYKKAQHHQDYATV